MSSRGKLRFGGGAVMGQPIGLPCTVVTGVEKVVCGTSRYFAAITNSLNHNDIRYSSFRHLYNLVRHAIVTQPSRIPIPYCDKTTEIQGLVVYCFGD